MSLLRHKEDIRTLGFVASFFVAMGLCWFAKLPTWAWALCYSWLLIMAMVGAVINHNALHSPVFRQKGLNRALHVALSFIYGVPVSMFVPVHNLSHHRHSQEQKDVMRSMKLRSRFNLINFLRAGSVMGIDTLKDDVRYFKVQRRKNAPIYRHMRLEACFLLAWDITILAIDWKAFLLFCLLPQQLSQGWIVGVNYMQHDGCDPDHSGPNFARNLTGPIFNWFFLNNGFHTIHHLKPGLHWSKTIEAHNELVAPHIHENLIAPNAFSFFFRFFFAPGTRRTYLGEPYAPPPAGEDEPWFYDSSETYSQLNPEAAA